MTTLKPPRHKWPLPVELLERIIDTMVTLESIEIEFRATKLQIEIISNILLDITNEAEGDHSPADHAILKQ